MGASMSTKLKKVREWLGNRIVSCYIFLMLAVLPLFFRDFYYDITEAKYDFVKYTTILCAIAYLIFHDAKEIRIKTLLTLKPFVLYLFFLALGAVSVLLSEHPYAAFFGSAGRYKGWFLYLVYGIGLAVIALEGRFFVRLLYFMEISAGLAGILALLNYYYIDVFGFFSELQEEQHLAFTSTFGNIGIFGEYISMMLTASGILFCISSKLTYARFLHGAVYEICVAALLMNSADAAFIGVAFFYAVFPFFLTERTELRRYLFLLISFFGTGAALGMLNKVLHAKERRGICLAIQSHITVCLTAAAALLAIYFTVRKVLPIAKKIYAVCLLLASISAAIFLIAVNTGAVGIGNEEIKNLICFSDEWGTYRGYIWRLMWESFHNFSVFKKLFGAGPDTLYYLYLERHIRLDYPIKAIDNAHNIYLQILTGHGILGLVSWLGWGISSLAACVKKINSDRRFLVILFCLITYAWNGIFGLNTIHVSAIAMIFMGISLCGFTDYKK